MQKLLSDLLQQALDSLAQQQGWDFNPQPQISISTSKHSQHGDFSSNIALILASRLRQPPRSLAEQILQALPPHEQLLKAEIAGAGFINFFVGKDYLRANLDLILAQGADYGRGQTQERVLLEFVSSNPTGPLHIGHGRGAVYGDSVGRLLQFAGNEVYKEYYVNDAGRQVDILGLSVFLRWLQTQGQQFSLPPGCYQGEYLLSLAQQLDPEQFPAIALCLPVLEAYDEQLEADAALERMLEALRRLPDFDFDQLKQQVVAAMVELMRQELQQLGVHYDNWFSELKLLHSGVLQTLEHQLQQAGHIYSRDGASWLRSSAFADEKDRVVRRANGATTYLASDIAYHYDKSTRPQHFQRLLNVWGADHHGYIDRLQAVMSCLRTCTDAQDQAELEIVLVQMAYLRRDGQRVSMSTRKATFYPLQALLDEIGVDALRFFYLLAGHNQDLELDVELARQQSKQNPVYYVQYAHARICQLLAKSEQELSSETNFAFQQQLELQLLQCLQQFPALVERAARDRAPHLLCSYSRELAGYFHAFYNELPILNAEAPIRSARLVLSRAVQIVLQNCATILGISMPERM